MRKIFLFCLLVHVSSGLFGPRKKKERNSDFLEKFKIKDPFKEPKTTVIPDKNDVVKLNTVEVVKKKGRKSKIEISEVQKKLQKFQSVQQVLSEFSSRYASVKPVMGVIGQNKEGASGVMMELVSKSGESQQVNFASRGGCEPVTACHDLRHLSHVHDGEIWPSSITYKKCGGCCMDHEKPVPVEYRNPTTVNIIVIPYDGQDIKIKEFQFVEHRECRCECKVKSSDCKANEIYDAWSCKCECDPNARKECGIYKHWSNIACGCVCAHPDTKCPSNMRFNTNTCQCG